MKPYITIFSLAIGKMLGNQYSEDYSIIRDTKLQLEDGNVIIVDYSDLVDAEDYAAIFALAPLIAESIADLIVLLHNNFDMELQYLHVVGFSMGGQLAGLVGQQVFQRCGEKVKHITALDPVGILLDESTPDNERLSADDAEFVEVIHTNAGLFGFLKPCGHVDYYPNGGKQQPGCPDYDMDCSHNRAYQLIPEMWLPVESKELLILKCSDIEYVGADYCRWLSKRMGDLHQREEGGVYYLETNAETPYGKGAFKAQFL